MIESLPKKLKNDAILEAVMEIRFEPDASIVPEAVIGLFVDADDWKHFKQARLAIADIPAPIRRADPNLKYQPLIELTSSDGSLCVRIGPQVIIYSCRGPYPGWENFGSGLKKTITNLFNILPNVPVTRIGIRYINALKSDVHGIKGIDDIDIGISVAEKKLNESLNLNFISNTDNDINTMSRIATADMAEGAIPEFATVIVDIDVFTPRGYSTNDADTLKNWLTRAHQVEKSNFFMILGSEVTERLREDQ